MIARTKKNYPLIKEVLDLYAEECTVNDMMKKVKALKGVSVSRHTIQGAAKHYGIRLKKTRRVNNYIPEYTLSDLSYKLLSKKWDKRLVL